MEDVIQKYLLIVLLSLAVALTFLTGCNKDEVTSSPEDIENLMKEMDRLTKSDYSFIGTVVNIDYLSIYDGAVFITHFDPRFVLEVDVESVSSKECPVQPGRRAFAIHSPSMLFMLCRIPESKSIMRPEIYGMKFRFSMNKSDDGSILWLSAADLK